MNKLAKDHSVSKMRRDAQHNQHVGDYAKAVQLQIELINQQGGYSVERVEDMHLLGLYLFQLGDIAAAATVLEQVYQFSPNEADVAKNLAICELKLGRSGRAIELLNSILETDPKNFEVRDVLAHAAGLSGDIPLAREHGTIALSLKHEAVTLGKRVPAPQARILSKINNRNPEENIISFSLWGADPKYLDGAIQNAKLARDIYPSWRCRFYIDSSVPLAVSKKLSGYQAQLVEMDEPKQAFDGLFWRFLVADDPNVARFIVRDCDAILNIRERAAVDLWCGSAKNFHVMRDFYTHTELMLAGLWGGVTNVLPNMGQLIEAFKSSLQLRTRIMDQIFLREKIWPLVAGDVLVHDSQFQFDNSEDFPPLAKLPVGSHVGQDRTLFS